MSLSQLHSTEHALIEIMERHGSQESAYTPVCSCGWIGSDEPVPKGGAHEEAIAAAKQAHELHSEGKNPYEGDGFTPEGKPWSERIR